MFYEQRCAGGAQWLAGGKIATAGGQNCAENGYEHHSAQSLILVRQFHKRPPEFKIK